MDLELKDYYRIILKKIWLILSVVVIATVTTGIISFFYTQPQYLASAKIIVNKSSQRQGEQIIDSSTINASIMLVNTYKEIIRTPAILDRVVEKFPDIHLTSEQLANKISVNSTNETQVITLAVIDSSYNDAAKIVNAVAEVFKEGIPTIMNVDNVTILNKAGELKNPHPIDRNPMVNILISLLVSLMISIGIVFLLEFLDDTIKTEKDVETYLGVPTLTIISRISSKELSTGSLRKQQRMVGESANVSINQ